MCKSDSKSAGDDSPPLPPPKNGGTYGSLPTHDPAVPMELSMRKMKSFGDGDDDDNDSGRWCTKKRLAVVFGLAAAGAALMATIGGRNSGGAASGGAGSNVVVGGGVKPLSETSPVDLGLKSVVRNEWNVPGKVWGKKLLGEEGEGGKKKPLPTNSWYQNLLTQSSGVGSTEANQVYTVPYILDTVGPITGLRVHWPVMRAGSTNMQMVYDAVNGLTVGTDDAGVGRQYYVDDEVETPSPLGVSLKWENESGDGSITTHLVRGMPYATLKYAGGINPAVTSGNALKGALIDGDDAIELTCGTIGKGGSYSDDSEPVDVEGEIQLHFANSDFTWVLFLSRPGRVRCANAPEMGPGMIATTMFQMRIEEREDGDGDGDFDFDGDDVGTAGADSKADPMFVRVAVLNQCTTGHANIKDHCRERNTFHDPEGYLALLREGKKLYAKHPTLDVDYARADDDDAATVTFDWDARSVDDGENGADAKAGGKEKGLRSTASTAETLEPTDAAAAAPELLSFALPHHQTSLSPADSDSISPHCIHTFHGRTCLVSGSVWSLTEDLGPPQSFFANRAPDADAVPDLAAALVKDLEMRPSDNLSRGAADTYFSGKVLAKLGRVALIASELRELAGEGGKKKGGGGGIGEDGGADDATPAATETREEEETDERRTAAVEAAKGLEDLPSEEDIEASVSALKEAVQVWIDGTAEAEYVYDASWGGLVNCGCNYEGEGDKGTCVNKYPDCPGLSDVNHDFGNGFYMDHHFHYGYHIYAAAVVAHYDPQWGRDYFDRILLYVRDIANPSPEDESFPPYRQKDWYLGSSWASGLISAGIPTPPHGRNQESSSEAIAAYEAVALFGDVMMNAFNEVNDADKFDDAKNVRNTGRLLTSTEVHAANRYWHVWNSPAHTNTYPPEYDQPVVGMMHETMASLQTWFAPEDFVSYGIQLLPFTPVSERRDDPDWASILYPLYRKSCFDEEDFCTDNGWTIVLSGLRATIGERKEARMDALSVPDDVFLSDGASGHSLSNTIWYISTRPDVVAPAPAAPAPTTAAGQSEEDGGVPPAAASDAV